MQSYSGLSDQPAPCAGVQRRQRPLPARAAVGVVRGRWAPRVLWDSSQVLVTTEGAGTMRQSMFFAAPGASSDGVRRLNAARILPTSV
jgi:hypothetical protein